MSSCGDSNNSSFNVTTVTIITCHHIVSHFGMESASLVILLRKFLLGRVVPAADRLFGVLRVLGDRDSLGQQIGRYSANYARLALIRPPQGGRHLASLVHGFT